MTNKSEINRKAKVEGDRFKKFAAATFTVGQMPVTLGMKVFMPNWYKKNVVSQKQFYKDNLKLFRSVGK